MRIIQVIKIMGSSQYGYKPEYTLVEKLQTISTKFRVNEHKNIESPVNFIRHYYDLYMLLNDEKVSSFIETEEYRAFKTKKFGSQDDLNIKQNPAFNLNVDKLKIFSKWYEAKSDIYFIAPPLFSEIIKKIQNTSL